MSRTEEWTTDLAAVAAANRWTRAEALAYSRSEQAVGQVAERVANERPDAFVGSALSADPAGAPTLYIKGSADEFIREIVAAEGVEIVIDDYQPYSAAELHDWKLRIHTVLQGRGYTDVATTADITARGRISVTVGGRGLDDSVEAIRSQLPPGIRSNVEIVLGDIPVAVDETIVAGGQMMGHGGFFDCTSGFTARKTTGSFLRGIVTAGHCTGINQIYDHVADVITSTTFVSSTESSWGDFEYHATNLNELDDFYADVDELRDVSSWEGAAGFSVGEFICVFGWATQQHICTAQVNDPDFRCGTAPERHQVLMTQFVTDFGDSGAPWFWNNRAFGIHEGYCQFPDGHRQSQFSKVDYLDEPLGVFIATT